ncbi:hypothetical protein OUZ56_013554 [Daphnia magna]|uniref:Uncharacterized protein n=1 Tax=Daphnia magna TaxID=35525 RepID=A0ABQ9Z682_9CRUS|nr:hypothetical protein OUZ56_013554 [Daphnia magna]
MQDRKFILSNVWERREYLHDLLWRSGSETHSPMQMEAQTHYHTNCISPSLAVVTSQIDSYMKCRNNSNIFLHYEKFVLWRKKAPYNSYIFDYNFKRRDDHTGHQEQKEFEDPDASNAERSAGMGNIGFKKRLAVVKGMVIQA